MPTSEEERLALLSRLTETLGADAARTLMESLPPTHWDQIATKDDLRALEERLVHKFTGEMHKVKNEMHKVTGEMHKITGEMHKFTSGLAEINGRVDGEFGKVYGELANVRGEIREVRGEVKEVRGEVKEVRGEVKELRGEIKELRGSISLEISKQTRTLVFMLCGFAVTVWISLLAIGGA